MPAYIPGDVDGAEPDPSILVIVDFVRDYYKQGRFKLELDAEFVVVCEAETPVALQPVRVFDSRMRRFRRD